MPGRQDERDATVLKMVAPTTDSRETDLCPHPLFFHGLPDGSDRRDERDATVLKMVASTTVHVKQHMSHTFLLCTHLVPEADDRRDQRLAGLRKGEELITASGEAIL